MFFFFNDTATTEIYTLSLHDALPILLIADLGAPLLLAGARYPVLMFLLPRPALVTLARWRAGRRAFRALRHPLVAVPVYIAVRSEEHTSELQSRQYLVCRLLLEKKKK